MKISWRVEWLLVSQRLCFAELIVRKETNEGIYVLVSQVFPIQQHVVLWHRDGSSLQFLPRTLNQNCRGVNTTLSKPVPKDPLVQRCLKKTKRSGGEPSLWESWIVSSFLLLFTLRWHEKLTKIGTKEVQTLPAT